MAKPLPRWLFKKYAILWSKFEDKEIKISEIKSLFKNKSYGTAMTDMIDCGWAKRLSFGLYKLNSPNKMIEVISNE